MTERSISRILRVVTVDDSPITAHRVRLMLAEFSFVQLSGHARDVPHARFLISEVNPDVVILDISLERGNRERNGVALLRTLKNKYPDMAVLMLTNVTEPQYRNTCLAMGASHFLDKSHDFEKLPAILKSMID